MNDRDAPGIIKSQRYIIDGKEYRGLSEIPQSERKKLLQLLENEDDDGVTDILQKKGASTSYIETKVVRVSSAEASDKAGNPWENPLRDFGVSSADTLSQMETPESADVESPVLKRQNRERRKERIRYYIVIFALVAVVVFWFLK